MSEPSSREESADFLAGMPEPVDPEAIERELSRLWKPLEPGGDETAAVTRACLSNVVFYLPRSACSIQTRDLLLAVGRRFPSRMILLQHAEGGPVENGQRTNVSRLTASISAVCHLSAPGAPPVCCEQITLVAADGSLDLFPGAVVPLLVPDVPVVLVILSDGGSRILDLLDDVVERVIFDSRCLPASALERVRSAASRSTVCVDDLAWRDTVGWRIAVKEIFEDPAARHLLSTIRSVEIHHAAGSSSRAALLSGWIASRLGRDVPAVLRSVTQRDCEPGQLLSLRIDAGAQPGGAYLAVERQDGASVLRIEHRTDEACVIPPTIPFHAESSADLLGGALERTTHQDVLRGALDRARG